MVLITGATGNLGSSVVAQLQKHLSKDKFIVTSSNENGVKKLSEQGYNARLADFSDVDSLNKAFNGVDKILLISTMDQNRFEQHKNVIDAAKNQNVKHLLYTGLAIKDIETSGVKDLMISHFQTEDYLKESGLIYTILRNTMYADALTQILGNEALKHDIFLPGGSGKVPYALRREMGEGTANLLVQEGHENKVYNITGSKLFGYDDVAKALSELANQEIKYQDITEEALIDTLKNIGFPDFAIYLHAGTLKDIKNTQYEIVDQTLEQLLGRPTADIKEFIQELFK